jgi:hypothetical protein
MRPHAASGDLCLHMYRNDYGAAVAAEASGAWSLRCTDRRPGVDCE